jgi:hypothetical protein
MLPPLATAGGGNGSGGDGGGGSAAQIDWVNTRLNTLQRKAVADIVTRAHAPLPYIIFGPPGERTTAPLHNDVQATSSLTVAPAHTVHTPIPSRTTHTHVGDSVS